MYHHERVPIEWFQPRPPYYHYPPPPPPISRPVSKSFNRISDFIFPDTIHVSIPPPVYHNYQQQQPVPRRYHRMDNYSLPVLNPHQRDLVVVDRYPVEEFDNVDLLYREQYYQPKRPVRRRYSSIIDERRIPPNDKYAAGLANRSAGYRERVRDRQKRHTTDNAYHSMLKSMLEVDESNDPNYILSYRTTLDPITDSESMTSLHEQRNEIVHSRVPINGTIPTINERERRRQRQYSSSISSRDSSTDTDITERRPIPMNNYYQPITSDVWERFPSNPVHQPDRIIPMNSSYTDTNNDQTISHSNQNNPSPFDNVINYPINNQLSSHDSTHHVSLCVNDLRTTLFIDEDTLNNGKTMNNGGKVHVRKRNTLMNGPIISAEHDINKSNLLDDNKLVRPYFLIRPQSLLMLPNETAKFKCCFGGDPFPTLLWSHNDSRIPEILAAGGASSTRYQTHKLNDIHYLDIGPVNLSDNGQIKCTLMNRFGREDAIAQLIVVATPADGTPRITQPLNNIKIIEGQPLKLSCGINGLQVTVNWFHNGKLISPTTPLKSDYNDENGIFTLSYCMQTDSGTIDCVVKNRFGEARTSCRIEVVSTGE